MLNPTYDIRHDAPITGYRGDCRAGLACEDRDLITEADSPAALSVLAEAVQIIVGGTVVLANPLAN